MLCTLYHDVERTASMLLFCDHSFYFTHAFDISCLLDAPRNLSNDFSQVRTVCYSCFLLITDYKVFPLDASTVCTCEKSLDKLRGASRRQDISKACVR
jgi:hypothetical protein